MSSYAKRRRKRYAEDAEYRERIRASKHAWYAANKERVNAERRRKRAEDPHCNKKQRAYYAESQRKTMLKSCYGISVEYYNALLARQGGKCAICREKPEGQTLCVDHCHVTGRIRGLLCRNCNVGLGNFRDDPRRMRAGIAYLEASRADVHRRRDTAAPRKGCGRPRKTVVLAAAGRSSGPPAASVAVQKSASFLRRVRNADF